MQAHAPVSLPIDSKQMKVPHAQPACGCSPRKSPTLSVKFLRIDKAKSSSRDIKDVGLPIAKRYRLKTDSTTRKVMNDASNISELEWRFSGGVILRALMGE